MGKLIKILDLGSLAQSLVHNKLAFACGDNQHVH